MVPALYIALSVFGAVYDIYFTVELVGLLKSRASPWTMEHNFPYLPGYAVLLTPIAWVIQSSASIAKAAKLLNFGFLIWFGLIAGKIAFPGATDSRWRGVLYFSCHPLLVAISLWHGQFEIIVATLLLLSMVYWQASAKDGSLPGGLLYGLAVSVKHWPLLALPVVLCRPLRRVPSFVAGMLTGVIGILGLHLALNGSFAHFSRIVEYVGIRSGVGILQAFSLPDPPGWTFICLTVTLVAGMTLRLKGARAAEGALFTILLFLVLSSRTAPQYWMWFFAFAPFCWLGYERFFWLVSGCLAGIVILQEWGYILGWQGEYPYPAWRGNVPHLRTYPHLSSAAISLFQFTWRPLFLVTAVASGLWYYRSYRATTLRNSNYDSHV